MKGLAPKGRRWLRQHADSPEARLLVVDGALLVIRVALAWIFIYYGAGKLFGTFHGPGLHATATFFAGTAHLHPGMFFAVLSGVTEFAGGVAIGIGLLGRLAALGLFADMIIAMITVTFSHGLIGNVDGEIRRFVAAHVAEEIDSPGSQQAKIIDVAGQVASAWDQDT